MELLMNWLRVSARLCSRVKLVVLGVLCMAVLPGATVAAEAESMEYAVKAAFLSKFGLYVQWPDRVFSSPSSAVNLCIIGEDPFGATLDEAVSGQRIGGRAIVIRRLKTVGRESGCHILYIGGTETHPPSQIIAAVRGGSVLTVTDTREPGVMGIVNFVIKDNRVRFEIDDEAAAQNGLAISSKLLSLALNVKPRH
jgi:hypothetical protein